MYGLIFGSFYNVLIYRLPNDESIIQPPSSCGNCHQQLKALDLIPVLSYVLLRAGAGIVTTRFPYNTL